MFYVFHQNNSGGYFTEPAINVIVEADSKEEANHNALLTGVYFDDDYKIDCSCCGTRWARLYESIKGLPEGPNDFDIFLTAEEAIESISGDRYWAEADSVPLYHVLRKDEEV